MSERKQRDGKELWLIATEAMAEHMKARKAEQPKHDWDDIAHWIAESQVVGVQAVYDLAIEDAAQAKRTGVEQAASLLDNYTHDLDTFGTITMNVLRRAIALLTE